MEDFLLTPLTLHFEVTPACNNSCPHCYASSWINQPHDTSYDLFDTARVIAANEPFKIVIAGGEPLTLGEGNLIEVFKIFNTKGIQISLNSNGRLLNKDVCALVRNNGLHGVLISLHSWDDALHDTMVGRPGAALETKQGIVNAIEAGLHVSVNQVVDTSNIHTMLETSTRLQALGVNSVSFTRLITPLDVNYKIQCVSPYEFLNELEICAETLDIPLTSLIPTPYCADPRVKNLNTELSCSGGISSAAISSSGEVRFCPQDTFVFGNIHSEDLASIWRRIFEWRCGIGVPSECDGCAFLPDCMGGCRIASKTYIGKIDGMDPWAKDPVIGYTRDVKYNEFDLSGKYRIRTDIRHREEGEDCLLFWKGRYMKVNWDGLKFVKSLPREFVPNQIINQFSTNYDEASLFLEDLYKRGVIYTG